LTLVYITAVEYFSACSKHLSVEIDGNVIYSEKVQLHVARLTHIESMAQNDTAAYKLSDCCHRLLFIN